jgi:YidC/Oxa1 family membrane protein insertase
MDQRRLLLALGLSLLVLLAYNELVLRKYPRTSSPTAPQAPPGSTSPRTTAPVIPGQPGIPDDAAAGLTDAGTPVTVHTDVMHLQITPMGARIAKLELERYRETIASASPPLELIHTGPMLPLTLALGKGTKETGDAGVAYTADRSSVNLTGDERAEVVFTGVLPDGSKIEKRLAFTGQGYTFDLTVSVGDPSPVGLILTPLVGSEAQTGGSSRIPHGSAIVLAARHLADISLKDIANVDKPPKPIDDVTWAGFAAPYFAILAVADGESTMVTTGMVEKLPYLRLQAPSASSTRFTIYAGPRERDVLAAGGHDLDRAVDFGWFWFIAIPLLQALRWIYRFTGNYGVAIIVLTTLVKVATIPLTRATFRNMREMQKVQPEMARLRERYKDDQTALQKEMMELYKRHGVNPFSGCLPMVLQLPIFVGLYNALSHAIELRHAPFMLWINDLSVPDRLMVGGIGIPVLTLLMGATMFVQQWMTPQQGDPNQQRMMMVMPLVFTFMFISFPAGLVLYWLVNNVLTIGQQYAMTRTAT